jgi:hypothetical protein
MEVISSISILRKLHAVITRDPLNMNAIYKSAFMSSKEKASWVCTADSPHPYEQSCSRRELGNRIWVMRMAVSYTRNNVTMHHVPEQ